MSKWGKIFLITTLIWQIPCIWWILYYRTPNTNLIAGLPESIFVFALLYLIYAIVFGYCIAKKYLADPTGKGIPVEELRRGAEADDH